MTAKTFHAPPLQRNLIIAITAIVAIALLLDRLYEYAIVRAGEIEDQQLAEMYDSCYVLSTNYARLLLAGKQSDLRFSVAAEGARADLLRLAMTDERGSIIASTRSNDIGTDIDQLDPLFSIDDARHAKTNNLIVTRLTPDHLGILGYAPVDMPPQPNRLHSSERGILFVHTDISALKAASWRNLFSPASLLRWATTFAVVVVLMLLLLRHLLFKPLDHLEEMAQRLGRGDWKAASNLSGDGELAHLGDTLNTMRARILEDLKRRKKTEVSLRKAKRQADAANHAKGEFLAAMSHEIRTPMNVILGMVDVMSESPRDEEQADYLRRVQKAGEGLLALINQILDLSKLDAGRLTLVVEPVDLHEQLRDIANMLTVLTAEKGLTMRCHIADDVPRHILCDSLRLRQILFNLLGNAVKFTERGGITVRACMDARTTDTLALIIEDTGIGVHADQIQRIFDAFTQAEGGMDRRYGGTGLGLNLSRRLVELMGGRIQMQSELGRGTRFEILLPIQRPTAPAPRTPNEATHPKVERDSPATSARILLVEDSEDNRKLIEVYLKREPHRLETANDGEEAIRKVVAQRYDLILMDIQMPVLDGYQATRRIRAWEREQGLPRTPVVALTAHALQGDESKSREAGCDGHLTKPIHKAKLLEAIARYADAEA